MRSGAPSSGRGSASPRRPGRREPSRPLRRLRPRRRRAPPGCREAATRGGRAPGHAWRRSADRRKHGGEPPGPDGDLSAPDSDQAAGREPPVDQRVARFERSEQDLVHPARRVGHPARARRFPASQRRLRRVGRRSLPGPARAREFRPRRRRAKVGRVAHSSRSQRQAAPRRCGFADFVAASDDLIARARQGKLELRDFEGTTISLTNPGTLGTTASVPRLMPGQGIIVATGAMDYPAEFSAMSPEALAQLAVSKVVTFTSTYDHRIIQGAESGAFLARIEELLLGQHDFYERLFEDLELPNQPLHWTRDRNPGFLGRRTRRNRKAGPRSRADQRLPGARTFDRRHRSAAADESAASSGVGSGDLRVDDLGSRPVLLDGRSRGRRAHAAARHHRRHAPRLLRQGGHRVSPHLEPAGEVLDSQANRRAAGASPGGAAPADPRRSSSPRSPSNDFLGRDFSDRGATRSRAPRPRSHCSTS